ncbi:MAG: hypothetical protein Ta2F_18520 [Termitinemataceae bacterium]|nr:MAG: hypothetical protein Ta2F_18520 [Termitinemataceae bacterium]
MNNLKDSLSLEQAAYVFDITTYTLITLTKDGIIPSKKDKSGYLFFSVKDILAWLSSKEGACKNAAA